MTPDAHQGAAEGPEASAARERLAADDRGEARWRRWGPYLSDRQWGTVREDYSADGNAWRPFPWNGHDPFLKERLFGLSGPEGNHGEDVKEIYFHRDSTPSHSWMRALYRYPTGASPTRSWWRKTAAAAATPLSTNCSTPASSRAIASATSR